MNKKLVKTLYSNKKHPIAAINIYQSINEKKSMDLLLTGVITFLTVILCWQAFFQNNVVLFQKRMELYQEYARKYHAFVDYADKLHNSIVFVIAKSTGSDKLVVTQYYNDAFP